jgi:hypothetical protein
VIVALASAINLTNHSLKVASPEANTAFGENGHEITASPAAPASRWDRTLTFAQRVAYQRAIEEVYWRHRIWPKERPDPKLSLDEVMPSAQLEKKVESYLRNTRVW